VTTPPERLSTTSSSRAGPPPAGTRSTSPVMNWVCRRAVEARNAVSSTPRRVTARSTHAVSRIRCPNSLIARITVGHPTPRSAATWATECASCPTRRHASVLARLVSTPLGRIAAVRSDQVSCGQARCGQRHTRFDQHSNTGRPPAGRSRSRRNRRSCSTATAPHDGHPMRSSVVSTCICSSPSHSATASTRNPGNPNIPSAVSCSRIVPAPAAGSALSSILTWGLRVRALGRTRIVRPQAQLLRQAEDHVATPHHASCRRAPLVAAAGSSTLQCVGTSGACCAAGVGRHRISANDAADSGPARTCPVLSP